MQAGEGLGINLKFYNSLSSEDQAVLQAAAKEMEKAEWKDMAEADDVTCPEFWKTNNLQVKKLTPEERTVLKEKIQPVYERARTEIPETAEILTIVEKTRAK